MYRRLFMALKLSFIFFLISFNGICFASPTEAVNVEVSSETLPDVSNVSVLPEVAKQPVAAPKPTVATVIPSPPNLNVKSYILIDANSGYVMAEKNAKEQVYPASLTKVMTLYLVADALRNGRLHFDDQVTVSEKAWRMDGSRMFIKIGTQVSARDLINGVATASGNDATVAMAEHMSGTEESFVDLMNQAARSLQMIGTNFSNSTGWPDPNNYTTAYDLAILARAWILNFPEYYPWFKEKWITYNGIKQPNRNQLLWRDSSVDGMKTGLTDEAGYCLIASAKRGDMRLIAVLAGAKSENGRTKDALALLNYGFRFYESRKIFGANTELATPKVLFGKESKTPLGLISDLYVTVPHGQGGDVKAKAEIKEQLKAPIAKGEGYGKLNVLLNGKVIASKPLVALKDNPRANFLFSLFDYITLMFKK